MSKDPYEVGAEFAAEWSDAALRFASCLYRALTDDYRPTAQCAFDAMRESIRAGMALQLGPSDCPDRQHWNLIRLLRECARRRTVMEEAPVFALAMDLGIANSMPIGGADWGVEMENVFELEVSAACMPYFGRKCQEHARKFKLYREMDARARAVLAA